MYANYLEYNTYHTTINRQQKEIKRLQTREKKLEESIDIYLKQIAELKAKLKEEESVNNES